LTYELVDFEVKFNRISIQSSDVHRSFHSGLSRFEEVESNPKILKRRKKCYEGSQLQFFRNLIQNVWNADNFRLFVGSFQENPDKYFKVSGDTDLKKVEVTRTVELKNSSKFLAVFNVLYKKNQQSKIIFKTNTFYVDQFGNNSNIEDITFSGDMAALKVADMLPLNYKE
jgi:REP element-mobilizing transposase RayT